MKIFSNHIRNLDNIFYEAEKLTDLIATFHQKKFLAKHAELLKSLYIKIKGFPEKICYLPLYL